MKNETKREKFLFWVINNSMKPWLWLPVMVVSSILASSGISGLGGLGLLLFGTLTFAAGINITIDACSKKIMEITKKEKKNDTAN